MAVLTSEARIQRIETGEDVSFGEGTFCLWVIHADKIPPHIAISEGDRFYSLKANGKDDGLPTAKIIRLLDSKNIPTLLYRISAPSIHCSVTETFGKYETTVAGSITCLQPLKEILNIPSATRVKEVLSELSHRNEIDAVFGLHLPVFFDGIPEYNPQDIHNRLAFLENV